MTSPGRSQLFNYAILALPLAFAGLPVYVHAPDFYASQLGVPLASIGGLLLILRSIDALQDPLIGSLSDRFHRWRHAILLFGLLLLGGGFWMIFNPDTAMPLLWLGVGVLICTTGFSIVSINLQALGSLWQVETAERTRVAGWREGLGLIGLLAASIAPSLLMQRYDAPKAFSYLALVYLPMLAVSGLLFLRWFRQVKLSPPRRRGLIGFGALWRDRWVRGFFPVYLLSALASAIPATLVIFFVRDYLQAEKLIGLFLLLYFASGACAMPLWQWLARRHDKITAWLASMFLASITFVWAFLLQAGDIWPFAAICMLSGIAFGADLALPSALLADHIARRGHERAASRYYAMLALLAKGALALATGIMLPALVLGGYQPGVFTQTAALPIAYALVPCLMKAGAALWIWRLSILFTQGDNHETLGPSRRRSFVA